MSSAQPGFADRHPELRRIIDAASAAALSLDGVYAVGGAVRDMLLGRDVYDVDVAVEGDGIAFAHNLARAMGGRVVSHPGFGTAAVVVGDDLRVDVATARTETYERPGALPSVTAASSISDDLRRRDFTINAIAAALGGAQAGELVDPFAGAADIEAGIVRVLHDDSFIDDPTRMFRAVRYAGRYGFTIEPGTRGLLDDALEGDALATVSPERLRNEVELLLEEPAHRSVRLLFETGLAQAVHPGLELDEWADRALARIDSALGGDETRQLLGWRMRLAALALPIGADGAHDLARSLSMRSRDVEAIARLVRAGELVRVRGAELVGAAVSVLRELLEGFDAEALEFASLVAADQGVESAIATWRSRVATAQLTVSGHDLLALGIPHGPVVGEVLEQLYDMKLSGELASPADERAAAERLVEARLTEVVET